jgi:predicted amidohydrolase
VDAVCLASVIVLYPMAFGAMFGAKRGTMVPGRAGGKGAHVRSDLQAHVHENGMLPAKAPRWLPTPNRPASGLL